MRVYNIEWDVDAEDICEYFGECSSEKAAELLGITAEAYDAMADDETTKIILAFARANPKKIWELFNLPENVTATYEGNTGVLAGDYIATASFRTSDSNFNSPDTITFPWGIGKADFDMSGVRWDYSGL